jgi:hypothetical protein
VLERAGKIEPAKELLATFQQRHEESPLAGEAAARLARLGGK